MREWGKCTPMNYYNTEHMWSPSPCISCVIDSGIAKIVSILKQSPLHSPEEPSRARPCKLAGVEFPEYKCEVSACFHSSRAGQCRAKSSRVHPPWTPPLPSCREHLFMLGAARRTTPLITFSYSARGLFIACIISTRLYFYAAIIHLVRDVYYVDSDTSDNVRYCRYDMNEFNQMTASEFLTDWWGCMMEVLGDALGGVIHTLMVVMCAGWRSPVKVFTLPGPAGVWAGRQVGRSRPSPAPIFAQTGSNNMYQAQVQLRCQ